MVQKDEKNATSAFEGSLMTGFVASNGYFAGLVLYFSLSADDLQNLLLRDTCASEVPLAGKEGGGAALA